MELVEVGHCSNPLSFVDSTVPPLEFADPQTFVQRSKFHPRQGKPKKIGGKLGSCSLVPRQTPYRCARLIAVDGLPY
jgi:hypothetical protein